ncbi:ABC transporter ATP-binding protein [Corynebacterium kutscheri]|uniref:ABC-type multidrug transport system, ATPase component n=1 Tax=Corynebacterium kutscheri TaxID=35755 RepID=A0A0F6TD50_9CORY|nr:ABC transporter ATP-binding protein [Corynebacterium kutscheri]AKE40561.1 ABC-type multidrug transport system, ATPase component [Corynebacterium kutscheri]VEH10956.1 ABC transporter ATP-binding protein [Corynebacterium kutscheri]
MPPLLLAHNLRREFDNGSFIAVDDVSLAVQPGTIHALLGSNGAGKTTTLRMCSTLLRPTSGSVLIDGIDAVAYPRTACKRIGLVLGGSLGFYPRASARDNLLFFADLAGVSSAERKTRVDNALERVGLSQDAQKKAAEFSTGMFQRLHIARAILGQPPLLLLDEPTSGLDPDVALRVRDLIRELANEGVGVLLTSHAMGEVEELADEISLLGAGKIAVTGQVSDIAAFAGITTTSTFTMPAQAANLADPLAKALTAAVGEEVVVKQRGYASHWNITVFWPMITNNHNEELLLAALDSLQAAQPEALVTRPALLEEAYLAVAERLAR